MRTLKLYRLNDHLGSFFAADSIGLFSV